LSEATGGESGPTFALRGVSVVRDTNPIVDNVTWTVRPGERWVVLGANGSGKTTLLSVAGARLWPTAGEVEVLGHRLGKVDVRSLRPRIATVSASVVRQLRGDLTAREIVVTGRTGALETWWHEYSEEDWAHADRLLGSEIGQRRWRVISEGERQQVLLARALMGRPELLLLDEPAAGLDLGARERLLARLEALIADPSTPPLVMVTHHLEEIPPGMTHAALIRSGRMVAAGRLADVLTADSVSDCFSVSVDVGTDGRRWWARHVGGSAAR